MPFTSIKAVFITVNIFMLTYHVLSLDFISYPLLTGCSLIHYVSVLDAFKDCHMRLRLCHMILSYDIHMRFTRVYVNLFNTVSGPR